MREKKPKKHNQFQLPEQLNAPVDMDALRRIGLGSRRVKERLEAGDIRSTNWIPGVSGWRLTKHGIELGNPNVSVPVQDTTSVDLSYTGGILQAETIGATGSFTTEDWTVTVVKGLVTSIVSRHSVSPSASPSLSPSISPSISPSVSPS